MISYSPFVLSRISNALFAITSLVFMLNAVPAPELIASTTNSSSRLPVKISSHAFTIACALPLQAAQFEEHQSMADWHHAAQEYSGLRQVYLPLQPQDKTAPVLQTQSCRNSCFQDISFSHLLLARQVRKTYQLCLSQ